MRKNRINKAIASGHCQFDFLGERAGGSQGYELLIAREPRCMTGNELLCSIGRDVALLGHFLQYIMYLVSERGCLQLVHSDRTVFF